MAKRALKTEDLFSIDVITSSQISPDGSKVAYSIKHARPDKNDYSSAIWVLNSDGSGDPRQLTAGEHRDTSPRWSPDGLTLAFLSDRTGVNQIYALEISGGEPRQITELERGASSFEWSPGCDEIVFLSSEGNGVDDETRKQEGGFIRHITRLDYRFDVEGYRDGRFEHVWIVNVESGNARQITAGDYNDLMPSWSPDSRSIAFVSNRTGQQNPGFHSQLHIVPADATVSDNSDQSTAVDGPYRSASAPTWSPDGKRIAFIGRPDAARAGENSNIFIADLSGEPTVSNLTLDWDRSPGISNYSDTWGSSDPETLIWSPEGDAIYTTANDQARVSIFRISTADGTAERIVDGDRTIGFVTISFKQNKMAFAAGDFTNPCDLYIADLDGKHETRLTEINAEVLSGLAIQQPEHLPFESFDGRFTVDAWLIRPVDYEEGKQYPLVQNIHGGPHSVFGHVFFFDMQLWASQGWNVLFVNPRATQGYGSEFGSANIADWGGADGKEQEQALDLAIERGGVDPERLAVTGLSYGGFMTNWIIGHSKRYKVAVSENSICNFFTFFTTSDIGWYWLEYEMEKPFWDNVDWYTQASPLTYIKDIETPTLFLQAETDYRCPIVEGEQIYNAMLNRGVPTEMVRFPGESHAMLISGTPETRLQRREHTLRWFNEYL